MIKYKYIEKLIVWDGKYCSEQCDFYTVFNPNRDDNNSFCKLYEVSLKVKKSNGYMLRHKNCKGNN